jgi:hypothetical protein
MAKRRNHNARTRCQSLELSAKEKRRVQQNTPKQLPGSGGSQKLKTELQKNSNNRLMFYGTHVPRTGIISHFIELRRCSSYFHHALRTRADQLPCSPLAYSLCHTQSLAYLMSPPFQPLLVIHMRSGIPSELAVPNDPREPRMQAGDAMRLSDVPLAELGMALRAVSRSFVMVVSAYSGARPPSGSACGGYCGLGLEDVVRIGTVVIAAEVADLGVVSDDYLARVDRCASIKIQVPWIFRRWSAEQSVHLIVNAGRC